MPQDSCFPYENPKVIEIFCKLTNISISYFQILSDVLLKIVTLVQYLST